MVATVRLVALQWQHAVVPVGGGQPTGTTARCHCNVTKRTVATIYNSREKFERYWFLVSKKHLKPYIRQYKCYHIAQNFTITEGDKKRLTCTIHKHLSTNKYLVVL